MESAAKPGRETEPTLRQDVPALRRRGRELLRLAKRDRSAAEEAFASLDREEQRNLVLAAAPSSRADLLFLSEDCTELVQSLPETEFYRTVRAEGMWEAIEIVEAATAEQIAFLLDQECWKGERFRPRKFLGWLRLFLECGQDEAERLLRILSVDLLVYGLKRYVRFAGDLVIAGRYHCTPEQVRTNNPTVREFIERLYDIDEEYFVRLMAWVSTLSDSTSEADALAAREGRLVEQGFPHMSQSQAVYEPVDLSELPEAERAAGPEDVGESRAILVSERSRALFFLRVIDRGIRSGRFGEAFASRIRHEVILLANKVMVADQVDLADEGAQRRVLDRVRRWVNIGFEALVAGDEARGVELLGELNLEYAFRVTHTLMTRLSVEIADVEMRLPERLLEPLLSERYAAAWKALHAEEPALPPLKGREHPREIGTLAEYRAALSLVREIAAIVDFHAGGLPLDVHRVARAGDNGGRPPPSAEEISGMLLAQILENGARTDAFRILPSDQWRVRLVSAVRAAGGPGPALDRCRRWLDAWLARNGHDEFRCEVIRAFWSDLIRETAESFPDPGSR